MTQKNTKKENNQNQNNGLTLEDINKAIDAALQDIIKNLNFNTVASVSDGLKIAIYAFNTFGEKGTLKKFIFTPVKGKTTLFAKYRLQDYFASQNTACLYNVNTGKINLIGDFKSINKSYLEYYNEIKAIEKAENEKLTKKEKLEKAYKNRLESMDKESLNILLDLLNKTLKTK